MSSPNPRPPRRRIAGERRPARPDEGLAPTPERLEDPVAPDPGPHDEAHHDEAHSGEVPAAEPPDDHAPGTGGPSWPVVAVLGVVALALVLAAAWLGLATWDYRAVRDQDAVDEASRTAPAAAERASTAILSYDYGSLDADEKAAERYMTPAYRKQYADTFDRLVRPNAAKVRAKVQAEVKASGVAHADADRVNVLLYVNQSTTSTADSGQPQVALNRVQLSMVRRDGTWLVNDITSY
jgi:Mce-associated membrane protein